MMKKLLASALAIALTFATATSASAADPKSLQDITPPVITNIQIDKRSIGELQKSTITVVATDEGSGVSRVNAGLILMNDEGERDIVTLYSVDREWGKVVKSNVFQGDFKITSTTTGKYHIAELTVYDNENNAASFNYDCENESLVSDHQTYPFSQEIMVANKFDTIDLFQITDKPKSFGGPTVYPFTAVADEKFTANDSMYKDAEVLLACRRMGSYYSYWIPLYNTYWDESENGYKPLPKNTYKSLSEISKYLPNGIYLADMLMLRAKDGEVFFRAPSYYFIVEASVDAYPVYLGAAVETLPELAQVPEGSTAFFYGSGEISKEFLQAVKNKNMTCIFDKDEVQLVINGADILESDGMDLQCVFNTTENYHDYKGWSSNPVNMETAGSIIEILNGNKAALLMFKETTKISSKTMVRMRLSHDIREAIGAKDLYVYSYDPVNNKLNLVKSNVSPGIDGYIELNMDRLYHFVITNVKL